MNSTNWCSVAASMSMISTTPLSNLDHLQNRSSLKNQNHFFHFSGFLLLKVIPTCLGLLHVEVQHPVKNRRAETELWSANSSWFKYLAAKTTLWQGNIEPVEDWRRISECFSLVRKDWKSRWPPCIGRLSSSSPPILIKLPANVISATKVSKQVLPSV